MRSLILSPDSPPDSETSAMFSSIAFALCGTVEQRVVTCVTSGGGRGVTVIWPGKGSRKLEQMKSFCLRSSQLESDLEETNDTHL